VFIVAVAAPLRRDRNHVGARPMGWLQPLEGARRARRARVCT
jgi:hypothetical protein